MTRMNRKSFLILTLVLVFAMAGTVFAASFSDTSGHWAATYINYAADKKLIEGYENGTFRPDNNITRAEFYTMVNRFANFTATTPTHFSDVKSGSWYADAVSRAVAAGYIKDSTGALYPDRAMDRDEAARIIAAIYGLPHNPNPANGFKDASAITNKAEVGALVARRVLNGYPDGTFKPNGSITRAEFAKILYTAANELGAPKAPTAPVKKPTTSNCPYISELKLAINRGEETLRRYNATTAQRTELQRAIDAAKAMVDRSENPLYVTNGTYYTTNRTGYYSTTLGTEYIYAGRSFTGEQDFYNYYRGQGFSDSYISTIWRLAEPRTAYVPLSGYRDFEDFYRAYAATYNYDRAAALRAWQGTTITCPYSRDEIYAARDRIDRAIGAITGTYRPGIGSIEVRFVDRGTIYARTYVSYGQGARVTPDPYRSGYRFLGWAYSPNGRIVDPARESIYRDTTFYAVWNDYAPVTRYNILVENGYAKVNDHIVTTAKKGDTITIVASVPKDKEFVKWESDNITFKDLKSPTATFFMPDRDVKVKAVLQNKTVVTPPEEEKTYTVTVNGGGTADPTSAKKGETVKLTAPDLSAQNKKFEKWTSTDVAEVNNKTESTLSFKMPEKNVTITAVYKNVTPAPAKYPVTVDGKKVGEFEEKATVKVEVTDIPEDREFVEWKSDDIIIQNPKEQILTFEMPAKAVNITMVTQGKKVDPTIAVNEKVFEALQKLSKNEFFTVAYDKDKKTLTATIDAGKEDTPITDVKGTGLMTTLAEVIKDQGVKTLNGEDVVGKSTDELKAIVLKQVGNKISPAPTSLKDLKGKALKFELKGEKDGEYTLPIHVTFGA